MNSRKRRLVIPINIGVTRSDRMKTNLGKASAIFNWHQPPGADYPYVHMCIIACCGIIRFIRLGQKI